MADIQRLDYSIICDAVETGSRVLDLGCGDGTLLSLLIEQKQAKVQGVEINEDALCQCVAKGVNVCHSDFESSLVGYPDNAFDYVILNQSMQETRNVDFVIQETLRVGKKVFISFPNFAYYKSRWLLFFQGRTPVLSCLPYHWYDTPNLHFLSLSDFEQFCRNKNVSILNKFFIKDNHRVHVLPNLFAMSGLYLVSRFS